MNSILMADFLKSFGKNTKPIKRHHFFLGRIAFRNKRPDKIHWPDSLECGMLKMHSSYKNICQSKCAYEILDYTNTRIKYTEQSVLEWGDRQVNHSAPTTISPIQFSIYNDLLGEWTNHYKSFADAKNALTKILSNDKNNNILKEMGFVYKS